MRFHVLTLFPEMFEGALRYGIMSRALDREILSVGLHNIRDFAHDRHSTVDDYPYSGGPGMVMKPEPLFEAVEAVTESKGISHSAPVILLTPQGRVFNQTVAEELAEQDDILLICGRYEGFDERVRQHLATDELSIGDYVLAGGEVAAMVVIEAVSRLVPGVVGSPESPAKRFLYHWTPATSSLHEASAVPGHGRPRCSALRQSRRSSPMAASGSSSAYLRAQARPIGATWS